MLSSQRRHEPRQREELQALQLQKTGLFVLNAGLRPLASATNHIGSLAFNVLGAATKATSGVLLAALPALAVLRGEPTPGPHTSGLLSSCTHFLARGSASVVQTGVSAIRKKGTPLASQAMVAGAGVAKARQMRLLLSKNLAQGKGFAFILPQIGNRVPRRQAVAPPTFSRRRVPPPTQPDCQPRPSKQQPTATPANDWPMCLGLQSSMM